MKSLLTVILGLAGALAGPSAQASPCDAASVVGVWSLVSIRADEPGVEAFYKNAPNEWMRFGPDGGFIYVAATRALTDPAEIGRSLDRAQVVGRAFYRTRIDASGQMVIDRNGTPFQAFQCQIVERDQGDDRTGDMVLTSVPGAPMLRRVQRRIAP